MWQNRIAQLIESEISENEDVENVPSRPTIGIRAISVSVFN